MTLSAIAPGSRALSFGAWVRNSESLIRSECPWSVGSMSSWSPEQENQLSAAVAGDDAAVQGLICAWELRIRTMVAVRIRSDSLDENVVDDVVQEVLIALARGIPTLRSSSRELFRAYLSTTVRNQVARHVGLARRSRALLGGVGSVHVDEKTRAMLATLAGVSTPSSHAARRERIDDLLEDLRLLEEPQREVLILAYFDHLNSSEIAQVLGIARTAAANRVVRATQALRARFQQRYQGDESPH